MLSDYLILGVSSGTVILGLVVLLVLFIVQRSDYRQTAEVVIVERLGRFNNFSQRSQHHHSTHRHPRVLHWRETLRFPIPGQSVYCVQTRVDLRETVWTSHENESPG